MPRSRIRMRLPLEKQVIDESWTCRNISAADIHTLGSLMLDSYRDTIDYEGETLEDAIKEVRNTIEGGYGPFLEKSSFIIEKDEKTCSASMVTYFEKIGKPLLSFSMTHPDFQKKGLATCLMKKSINALLDEGYEELYLVVTDGNVPAQNLYKKMGFLEVK